MQPGSKISGSVFTTHLRRCEEVFADFSRSRAKQIDKLSPVSIAGLGSVSCPGLGKTLRVRPPAALGCGGKDLEIIYIYIYRERERERERDNIRVDLWVTTVIILLLLLS